MVWGRLLSLSNMPFQAPHDSNQLLRPGYKGGWYSPVAGTSGAIVGLASAFAGARAFRKKLNSSSNLQSLANIFIERYPKLRAAKIPAKVGLYLAGGYVGRQLGHYTGEAVDKALTKPTADVITSGGSSLLQTALSGVLK